MSAHLSIDEKRDQMIKQAQQQPGVAAALAVFEAARSRTPAPVHQGTVVRYATSTNR